MLVVGKRDRFVLVAAVVELERWVVAVVTACIDLFTMCWEDKIVLRQE